MKEQLLNTSKAFWSAMERADEAGMREIADAECTFVHIGVTCRFPHAPELSLFMIPQSGGFLNRRLSVF
ncbi:MAG: hypothetical protein LUE29_13385 [Lachnospiraceae bacterium]|nr:hypothetical protein [Lachnospiraceae bacterium]